MIVNPFLSIIALISLTLCVFSTVIAQDDPVIVSSSRNDDGSISLMARNTTLAPYTVMIDVTLENMTASDQFPAYKLVPPDGSEHELTRLVAKPQKQSGYSSEFMFYLGDTENARHDDYVYRLPFEPGTPRVMSQGYNGKFSHMGKSALDFDMPEGTAIVAARDGKVIRMREDSNRGCKTERCKDDANYITILHRDGTFAEYVHLQKDGVVVEPGEMVSRGQLIGYSGNTGWSSGPHLHFEVFLPIKGAGGREAIETKFNSTEGEVRHFKTGKTYSATAD